MSNSTPRKGKAGTIANCNTCGSEFLSKNKALHDQLCSRQEEGISSEIDAQHGFVLSPYLAVTQAQSLPESVTKLSGSIARSVIFVHPDISARIDLKFGDPMWVTGQDGATHTLSTYFPSKDLELFTAAMPSDIASEGFYFLRPVGKYNVARTVVLQPVKEKSFLGTSQFRDFMNFALKDTFIFEKQRICVKFYAQILHFDVVSYELENEEKAVDKLDTKCSQLNLSFSSLNINEKKQPNSGLERSLSKLFESVHTVQVVKVVQNTEVRLLDTSTKLNDSISHTVAVGTFGLSRTLLQLISTTHKGSGMRVLIHGISGVGKTFLCESVLKVCHRTIHRLDPGTWCQNVDDDGPKLAVLKIFAAAKKCDDASVILLDNLEYLLQSGSKEHDSPSSTSMEVVLNSLIDSIEARKISVIGVTSRPECLSVSLRRRFEAEIEVPVPSVIDREMILNSILGTKPYSGQCQLSKEDVSDIAACTHGYTASDLVTLCKLSASEASNDKENVIKKHNLESCRDLVRPSAMKEIVIEVPKVFWSDIGGMHEVKKRLQQVAEWPLKFAKNFARLGIQPPKGVLLYGPPGCSKTMIARAVATESGLNFFAVKGPELFSKWVGESERAVRELFRKARLTAPSLIFFDEIDALASARGGGGGPSGSSVGDRVLAQLLTELDGLEPLNHVITIAATNRPDVVDRALLRPGRFDRLIYVRLPDGATRQEIFKVQFRKMPVEFDKNVDLVKFLVEKTDFYSGAEIVSLCQEAAVRALERSMDVESVTMKDFEFALTSVIPRTDQKLLHSYETFSNGSF